MKTYLLLLILIFQTGNLFSQSRFVIQGNTNWLVNGKAVLIRNAPSEFYSFKIKSDTAFIHNQTFVFAGLLKYPEQFRLIIMNNDHNYITEPFFVDSGLQKIIIDSGNKLNDFLDFGYGVTIDGSKTSSEYFKNYLPLYNNSNKRIDSNDEEGGKCDSVKNAAAKKACNIKWSYGRLNIIKGRDSILLNYATLHPMSRIIPWALDDRIFRFGYNNYFQRTYDLIAPYLPRNINSSLRSLLMKEKMKAPGSAFPLIDFVQTKTPGIIQKNKYTLVDFWFSACRPCIGQFNLLKKVYKKYNKNGFDMVAISIDREKNLPEYEKILRENNYPWKQILDTNGIKTNLIDIKRFPSNFLINDKGEIVKVDIDPYMLEDYLDKNL
jgi:thiol-disulfide isomerase/thioredoxin